MSLNQQSGIVEPGFYDAFRTNGAPTYYAENHTPWMADILEAGFIFAMCILLLSFYFLLPGVHGKERFFTFIWATSSIFVGGVILLVNYGYEWETSEIHTATKYKAGTGRDINATVGIHIGLRGMNITLKGEPENQLNETINYNEHFGWTWSQGRLGFGPFASEFNQEYREAQFRGVPLPVLWIAEYFTFDGEGIRWGRFYRQAGLYANMCLWLAFPSWILANILIFVLLRYGAYFSILTGLSMCTANVIKHYIRNPNELKIPFESSLELKYGISFWLCLGTGGFCIFAGLIVLIMDLRLPSIIAKFFSVDVLQDDELLTREVSAVSNTSARSTNTNNSDLTEIVEIGNDGEVIRKIDVRPPGAPKTGSNVNGKTSDVSGAGKKLDDVFGDDKDEWEDYTSESDLEPTDDEEDFEIPTKQTPKTRGTVQHHTPKQTRVTTRTRPESRGFISRFQAPRRQASAVPRRRLPRNSVSPESGVRPGWRI